MKLPWKIPLSEVNNLLRTALIAVGTYLLLFVLLSAAVTPQRYDIRVGTPADATIYASEDVVDTVTTAQLRDAAAAQVDVSYKSVDESVTTQVTNDLSSLFERLLALYDARGDASQLDLQLTPAQLEALSLIHIYMGALPIINENDTVAVEEIVFGDNDTLSALVAREVRADALIILTDIDGLHERNPREDPTAPLIHVVEAITSHTREIAGGTGSSRGTGGMITKIEAADIATRQGITTAIIDGSDPEDIYRLLDGEEIGTVFLAHREDQA